MDDTRPLRILYAEDNLGDIRLTQEAFKHIDLPIKLDIVMDGVEAMEFLRKEGKNKNAITPDLILLDLNMPRKDGRELLREIKEDLQLQRIPVVILTISKSEQDIEHAYLAHANSYIIKPLDFHNFQDAIKTLVKYWFTIVTTPPKHE